MNPSRRLLLSLARIAISAGLLAWVISRSGLDALIASARGASLPLLAAAYALAIAGMFIRVYRWLILLRAVGAKVSVKRATYLYFVGGFFNVFLPTGLGGDVVRVLEIGEGATSEQAAGTVLVDRLTGFIILFVMALAALPFAGGIGAGRSGVGHPGYLPGETMWFIGLLAGGVCVASLLLFEGRLLRRGLEAASHVTRHTPLLNSVTDWTTRTYEVITACGTKAILGALGVSAVYNLSVIWATWLVGRALGIHVSMWHLLLFTPIAVTALLVPISIGGLGVREGLFVALFGQVGLTPAQATALSLGAYSLDVFTGLLGGGVYLLAGVRGLRRSSRGAGEQPVPWTCPGAVQGRLTGRQASPRGRRGWGNNHPRADPPARRR